ncbi:MAG: hypothetical protein U5L75_00405 [Candidatus Campbellbacteria bacterium]|nr:hypothetical protein [Candidatus Campbellbacteria bacterium]
MQAFFESAQETFENNEEVNSGASGAVGDFLDNFDGSEEGTENDDGVNSDGGNEENLQN